MLLVLLRRRPPRRRPSLARFATPSRSRASHAEVAFTFDDVLQDLDPGWRAIDWNEVEG